MKNKQTKPHVLIGLFVTVKINTSNAKKKKTGTTTTPSSYVYRQLNNQVLDNLKPDFIKTHLLVLITRTTSV